MTTKMFSVIVTVVPFLIFLFHLVGSESIASTAAKTEGHVNQEKACDEYQKCVAYREGKTGTIKKVRLGENTIEIQMDKHICAYKSNCRKERRALCRPHMGKNGSIEMKVVCQITWLGGTDETDASDPITASNIETNQLTACSNFYKCIQLPDVGLELLGLHPFVQKHKQEVKLAICADITNCRKIKVDWCNKELLELPQSDLKLSKLAALFCAITWYADEEENSIGSRSLGGGGSKSQQILAAVCPSTTDGVCSLY